MNKIQGRSKIFVPGKVIKGGVLAYVLLLLVLLYDNWGNTPLSIIKSIVSFSIGILGAFVIYLLINYLWQLIKYELLNRNK